MLGDLPKLKILIFGQDLVIKGNIPQELRKGLPNNLFNLFMNIVVPINKSGQSQAHSLRIKTCPSLYFLEGLGQSREPHPFAEHSCNHTALAEPLVEVERSAFKFDLFNQSVHHYVD